MRLYTIGYEGLNESEFYTLLGELSIATLVDVRELPLSRKPGFSKKALSNKLPDYEIQYIHEPSLGCPSEIRHDYKQDNDWVKYSERFLDYICTQTVSLTRLAQIASASTTCLMCFERDYSRCHRSYLSLLLSRNYFPDLNVINIDPTMTFDNPVLADKKDQLLTTDVEIGALCP